jgi:hypothetical protein
MALGITDHVWSVAELIEAALKAVPTKPTPTPTQRRRQFRVIQGDLFVHNMWERKTESACHISENRIRYSVLLNWESRRRGEPTAPNFRPALNPEQRAMRERLRKQSD